MLLSERKLSAIKMPAKTLQYVLLFLKRVVVNSTTDFASRNNVFVPNFNVVSYLFFYYFFLRTPHSAKVINMPFATKIVLLTAIFQAF